MLENIDFTLVNWSRGQFALTAMFHWLFVPLTLGLSYIMAYMETMYVKTGDPEWKRITKFWMKLFGINFAIGVATGIILEFEFGTNWSNYSWFVGDIFGAPLAIEGIMAFFLESTFIAVMFFGWDKVSKRFHLLSTWLTALGASLSAIWILVANAWMQNPVGTFFNPETARNEMTNFWDVFLSETAVNKFVHTITSGFVLAAIFVIGVSSWYLLKHREQLLAKRSIVIASVFGLLSSLVLIWSGDSSAKEIVKTQPMKLAAMEALYEGQSGAPLVAFGILRGADKELTADSQADFLFKIEIPSMLSWLAYGDGESFVAGIKDLILGNEEKGILSYKEKIKRGYEAQQALIALKEAIKEDPDGQEANALKAKFRDPVFIKNNVQYFGYGNYYDPDPEKLEKNAFMMVPPISMTFYAFHIMVILGGLFLLLFVVFLYLIMKNQLHTQRWLLWAGVWSIPLVYIASQAGWIVAEVGRQPWVIQDLMPTMKAVTQIDVGSVMTTFILFAITFIGLFIAEIRIMLKQIKVGPQKKEDINHV
ncbi:cytochrome ubiquinol oxidase subunit I [Thermophagus xiamenensis]|jgi:cytochrome d ubiquinol oxidase subunit I|uniref:Cytochrome bd-I ubiquinol oxidase subunit 1 apoprotein n=1 Tax=Thermophagus xiamenensis TaxID=385682 RepID=A0A1I1UGU1_9BACT|nr:cytochrome ubiquinol oxidase subunit I [Thermophagus xiamenensis]SFD70072.1 cytochrome bd-I ubiquinol oxidase subunit 1 apoprotein [Thermophagus xiamenensis]